MNQETPNYHCKPDSEQVKSDTPIETAAGPMCPDCGRGIGCRLAHDESPCQCKKSETPETDAIWDLDVPIGEAAARLHTKCEQLERERNEAIQQRDSKLRLANKITIEALEATENISQLRARVEELEEKLKTQTESTECWIFNAKKLQEQVNEWEPERRENKARIAELGKDKIRLDWLNSQGMGTQPRVWSVYQFSDNIRQAIDEARKGDSK